MSRSLRSVAASVSLGSAGAYLASSAIHDGWLPLFMGGAILGGAALMSRRTAVAQVLARGVAWAVIVPAVLATTLAATHGGPIVGTFLVAPALAALALVLGHPQRSRDALAGTFDPLAFRSWLLASATSSVALGLFASSLGLAFVSAGLGADGCALIALGLFQLAAGVGVARMRSWGVLMGGVAALLSVVVALKVAFIGLPMAAGVVPGAMMISAILAARAGLGRAETVTRLAAPARVRVAEHASTSLALEEEESAEGHARAQLG